MMDFRSCSSAGDTAEYIVVQGSLGSWTAVCTKYRIIMHSRRDESEMRRA